MAIYLHDATCMGCRRQMGVLVTLDLSGAMPAPAIFKCPHCKQLMQIEPRYAIQPGSLEIIGFGEEKQPARKKKRAARDRRSN
jgi:hypothetical protein